MGLLKSAMMFKVGQAAFNRFSRRGVGTTRPAARGAVRRPGVRRGRSTGGTLGRLARSLFGGRRR